MLTISIWNGKGANAGVLEPLGWAAPGATRSVRSVRALISVTLVSKHLVHQQEARYKQRPSSRYMWQCLEISADTGTAGRYRDFQIGTLELIIEDMMRFEMRTLVAVGDKHRCF